MGKTIEVRIVRNVTETPPRLWRVVYDNESEDWGYQSRTLIVKRADGTYFSQLPAVYGYSPEMAYKPNDYHVDESAWQDAYYELNDYNVDGVRDGFGHERCENFLFKGAVALYNANVERGFPRRELLTMSGNLLREIGWAYDNQARRYLKFETLRAGQNVHAMTFESHPHLIHRFMIVQETNGETATVPKVNRNGYLYYYLVSQDGFGYMPERNVRQA